jgi:hypothetical protein
MDTADHRSPVDEATLALARLLLTRLERLSADSSWAHRASGLRGALLAVLEAAAEGGPFDPAYLQRCLQLGFQILERAARQKT